MNSDSVIQWLTLLGVVGLGLYFRTYLKKKAENLATKEDIAEITKKVELIKGEIGSRLYVHQIRYQNEFQILKELSEKIIDLKDATLSLRPVMDSFDPKESEGQRRQKRLSKYSDAAVSFYKFSEHRRPFYPEAIYASVNKLHDAVWKEVVHYRTYSDKGLLSPPDYWEKAAANSQEISKYSDEVIALIRNRVKYWEDFPSEG